MQILKPKAVIQKDKQLSKQFKDQLKLISCNASLGTCIPDVLIPVGLEGLHIVLQRVKDESGVVINLQIDKREDEDIYDYSEEALKVAVALNLSRLDSFYRINDWVEFLACSLTFLIRGKRSRIWRIGHLGKWQVRVWCLAFVMIYPSLGFKANDLRNLGMVLMDFLFFFGWVFDAKECQFEIRGNRAADAISCILVEKKRQSNDDITIDWREKDTVFNIGPGFEIKELFQAEYRYFLCYHLTLSISNLSEICRSIIQDYKTIAQDSSLRESGHLSSSLIFTKTSFTMQDYEESELQAAKSAAMMLKVRNCWRYEY